MHLTTTKVPFPTPVLLLAAVLPAVALGVLLLRTTDPSLWSVVAAVAAGAVPLGVMVPARHWLEIGPDELVLRYRPLLTRRIATRDVVRLELIERVHPLRYGGSGLRLGAGKEVAFVNRPGPALRIEPARGWSSVIVLASPEEAEAVRRRLVETTGRPVERRSA